MATRIRPYESRDRAAVRSICFQTGFLGNPIAEQLNDEPLFADSITSYYTDREPESCFVVETDGKVVAYLLGCLDSRNAWSPEWIGVRHAILRLLPLRPGSARFYWRSLIDTVRDAISAPAPRMHPELALYPAHTHFSVLPEARNLPVAPGLFRAFFKYAKERGCVGVHGEVFLENGPAMALHRALGFETAGAAWPAPGFRLPSGQRLHIQLFVRKL